MSSAQGFVGYIKIKSQHHLIGEKLLNDVTDWVSESGWNKSVRVSFEIDPTHSYIELIPGEFQSNGHKKIGFNDGATLSDVEEDLYNWLYKVQE